MAHSLPTTAHRHLSIYVHDIVFMKFLCGLQRFGPFFICLKPDTKRCKPHGTPSTWPLEDQEFYMSFSFVFSFLPWVKYTHKTLFPVAHPEHSSTEQRSTMTLKYSNTAWQRDFYEILTRSLRDLYEIGILHGKAAGIFSTLPFSALRLSKHFYSSIRFSSLLFCI